VKALSAAQKKTKQSAIGFFLNIGSAVIVVYATGMDSADDWLMLSWCVVCMIACAWYVQDDIKKEVRREQGRKDL
jgi:hypothetical protein